MVQAVRQYVTAYETRQTTAASPSAQPSGPAEAPDPESAAAALEEALAAARTAIEDGCPQPEFIALLTTALEDVTADGAIARAVLLRLTANLTGTVGSGQSVQAAPGDDLAVVLARAAPGATVYLAAGDYDLPDTLVVLESVTLAGADRKTTRLRSAAEEMAVLVMTSGLVGFRDLSLERDRKVPGSGIVTGGASTVFLERVTVSGARSGPQRQGGAGVDLTGSETAAGPGRTTFEVTDAEFADNSWAGVAVSGGHRVSIVSARFSGNDECGLCFLGSAEGSVENSRFRDNGIGVAAVGTSTPVVSRNTITGGEVGAQAGGRAEPTLEGNRITGTARAAVIFTDTAAGVLRDTTCEDVPVGIALARTALPTLIDNDCTVVRAE